MQFPIAAAQIAGATTNPCSLEKQAFTYKRTPEKTNTFKILSQKFFKRKLNYSNSQKSPKRKMLQKQTEK